MQIVPLTRSIASYLFIYKHWAVRLFKLLETYNTVSISPYLHGYIGYMVEQIYEVHKQITRWAQYFTQGKVYLNWRPRKITKIVASILIIIHCICKITRWSFFSPIINHMLKNIRFSSRNCTYDLVFAYAITWVQTEADKPRCFYSFTLITLVYFHSF